MLERLCRGLRALAGVQRGLGGGRDVGEPLVEVADELDEVIDLVLPVRRRPGNSARSPMPLNSS